MAALIWALDTEARSQAGRQQKEQSLEPGPTTAVGGFRPGAAAWIPPSLPVIAPVLSPSCCFFYFDFHLNLSSVAFHLLSAVVELPDASQ